MLQPWKIGSFILVLFLCFTCGQAQSLAPAISQSRHIPIQWKKHLRGDYSFRQNWSYPDGIVMQSNGKAGCGDGGFCSPRCYNMLDTNGIVHPDSAAVYYRLIDTSHTFHGIACEAWCYEWAAPILFMYPG